MTNPLTMKLEQFTRFEPSERMRLDELMNFPKKSYVRGNAILPEGKRVDNIHLVLQGLAARAKTLPDGNRQMMAFLVPGDLCDVEVLVLEAMDHDIIAVTDTICVLIPADTMETLLSETSNVTKAMWWSTMTDSAVLREWIVSHGRRDARERIAHLCCELLIRYRIVGEATGDSFPFPLTQEELADATGLTPVHVNRTLQQLRAEQLIDLNGKVLTVLDADRLNEVAQFESTYLHLTRTERRDKEVSGRAGDLVSPSARGMVHDTIDKVRDAVTGSRH